MFPIGMSLKSQMPLDTGVSVTGEIEIESGSKELQ